MNIRAALYLLLMLSIPFKLFPQNSAKNNYEKTIHFIEWVNELKTSDYQFNEVLELLKEIGAYSPTDPALQEKIDQYEPVLTAKIREYDYNYIAISEYESKAGNVATYYITPFKTVGKHVLVIDRLSRYFAVAGKYKLNQEIELRLNPTGEYITVKGDGYSGDMEYEIYNVYNREYEKLIQNAIHAKDSLFNVCKLTSDRFLDGILPVLLELKAKNLTSLISVRKQALMDEMKGGKFTDARKTLDELLGYLTEAGRDKEREELKETFFIAHFDHIKSKIRSWDVGFAADQLSLFLKLNADRPGLKDKHGELYLLWVEKKGASSFESEEYLQSYLDFFLLTRTDAGGKYLDAFNQAFRKYYDKRISEAMQRNDIRSISASFDSLGYYAGMFDSNDSLRSYLKRKVAGLADYLAQISSIDNDLTHFYFVPGGETFIFEDDEDHEMKPFLLFKYPLDDRLKSLISLVEKEQFNYKYSVIDLMGLSPVKDYEIEYVNCSGWMNMEEKKLFGTGFFDVPLLDNNTAYLKLPVSKVGSGAIAEILNIRSETLRKKINEQILAQRDAKKIVSLNTFRLSFEFSPLLSMRSLTMLDQYSPYIFTNSRVLWGAGVLGAGFNFLLNKSKMKPIKNIGNEERFNYFTVSFVWSPQFFPFQVEKLWYWSPVPGTRSIAGIDPERSFVNFNYQKFEIGIGFESRQRYYYKVDPLDLDFGFRAGLGIGVLTEGSRNIQSQKEVNGRVVYLVNHDQVSTTILNPFVQLNTGIIYAVFSYDFARKRMQEITLSLRTRIVF